MNRSEDYFLAINTHLKQVYLGGWLNSYSNNFHDIELVYSDNLEDINTQLLFYGYKIIKCSKRDYNNGYITFYDLESI